MPFPVTQLPWWRSKIIVGALVSIVCKLLLATGLIGELAPESSDAITDTILLIVGGLGDLVAIFSRVVQKAAPSITGSKPPSGVAGALLVLLLTPALMLSACATVPGLPGSPATVADKTLLDEKVGTLATNTYTAAATAAKFSIQLGLVRDPAMIRQIGVLDNRAFAAVEALRGAYLSGNATSYAAAIDRANGAVTDFVAAVKGER